MGLFSKKKSGGSKSQKTSIGMKNLVEKNAREDNMLGQNSEFDQNLLQNDHMEFNNQINSSSNINKGDEENVRLLNQNAYHDEIFSKFDFFLVPYKKAMVSHST